MIFIFILKNKISNYYDIKKVNLNYGMSYSFELKLEKNFHIIKKNNEDYAMIVNIGENNKILLY